MDSIENVHDHYAFYSQNMICIIPESISQKFSLVTVKNRRKQEAIVRKLAYLFRSTGVYRNKTPAEAFTPPADEK